MDEIWRVNYIQDVSCYICVYPWNNSDTAKNCDGYEMKYSKFSIL